MSGRTRCLLTTALVVAAALGGTACQSEAFDPGDTDQLAVSSEGTVFGSTVARGSGESRAEAKDRLDATFGPLTVVRYFSAHLPPDWKTLQRELGSASLVISFKADPASVLAGEVDHELGRWFRDAPTDRDIYWAYFHEPENNVEHGDFSAEEFRLAWEHIAQLASSVDNPSLHPTVVLMCYTVHPASGRDWRDYVPDTNLLEVLGWDCYNSGARQGRYHAPERLLARAVNVSRTAGADWAVAELGSRVAEGDDGTGRAAWLVAVGDYARREGARFVTYFNSTVGADFRLRDEPSVSAWRSLVSGG